MEIIRQPQNRYKQQAETDDYETRIRIQRRTVYLFTSFHPGTDGEKPTDGRFVYLFIRLLYQSSLPYIERLNGCDQYLLIYCKDGKGHVRIQDRQYELSADQYIILPPHIYHQYEADEKIRGVFIGFTSKEQKLPISPKDKTYRIP